MGASPADLALAHGPAVVGLTIPILAFLGLFSISRGIRDLVGGTITPPAQETWQVPSRRRP